MSIFTPTFFLVRASDAFSGRGLAKIAYKDLLEAAARDASNTKPALSETHSGIDGLPLYISVPNGWSVWVCGKSGESSIVQTGGTQSSRRVTATAAQSFARGLEDRGLVPCRGLLFLKLTLAHIRRLKSSKGVLTHGFSGALELVKSPWGHPLCYCESSIQPPFYIFPVKLFPSAQLDERSTQPGQCTVAEVDYAFGINDVYISTSVAEMVCERHGWAFPEKDQYLPSPPGVPWLITAVHDPGPMRGVPPGVEAACRVVGSCFVNDRGEVQSGPMHRLKAAQELRRFLPELFGKTLAPMTAAIIDPGYDRTKGFPGGREFTAKGKRILVDMDTQHRPRWVNDSLALIFQVGREIHQIRKHPPPPGVCVPTLRQRLEQLGFKGDTELNTLTKVIAWNKD